MRGFLTWSIQCLIEHDTKIGAKMGPEGLEQIVSRKGALGRKAPRTRSKPKFHVNFVCGI